MEKKIGGYILRKAESSEIPIRGKWKQLALEFIDALDQMPERNLTIDNIKTKQEYDSLYDALKHVVKRNNLKIEVKRQEIKEGSNSKYLIFLLKDFRYFVR